MASADWRDNLLFDEYFTGQRSMPGPSRQTAWTGLTADIIRRPHSAVPSMGAALAAVFERA